MAQAATTYRREAGPEPRHQAGEQAQQTAHQPRAPALIARAGSIRHRHGHEAAHHSEGPEQRDQRDQAQAWPGQRQDAEGQGHKPLDRNGPPAMGQHIKHLSSPRGYDNGLDERLVRGDKRGRLGKTGAPVGDLDHWPARRTADILRSWHVAAGVGGPADTSTGDAYWVALAACSMTSVTASG